VVKADISVQGLSFEMLVDQSDGNSGGGGGGGGATVVVVVAAM
jgi:hypothetical protein